MDIPIPKNVRQMGEPQETRKIYVEDYVVTYLKQYAKEETEHVRGAVLLGNTQELNEIPYLFIRSALEIPDEPWETGIPEFTDALWLHLYEDAEKYFQGQEILGWFLSTPGFAPKISYEMLSTHRSHFSGRDRVLLIEDPLEGEEAFFAMDGGGLVRQEGYFVFYERNEPMQRYMLEKKDGKSVDAQGDFSDRAARSFRRMIQEKKDQSSQKRVMAFLYGVSTFLVMVVLVIGITMINNYEKMEQVELALNNLTQNLEMREQSAAVQEPDTSDAGTDAGQKEELTAQNPEGTAQDSEVSDGQEADASVLEENASGQEAAESSQFREEDVQETSASIPETYLVEKGDTLLSISRKIYGDDWHIQEICQLNGIEDSDRILAGEKILLPR